MPSFRREVATQLRRVPDPRLRQRRRFAIALSDRQVLLSRFQSPNVLAGPALMQVMLVSQGGQPYVWIGATDMESRSLSAVPELPPMPPRRTAAIPEVVPMVPAIGSFNIPLPGGASDEGDIVSAAGNASDAATRSDQRFNLDLEQLAATESKAGRCHGVDGPIVVRVEPVSDCRIHIVHVFRPVIRRDQPKSVASR
jgi:hypothetical protein